MPRYGNGPMVRRVEVAHFFDLDGGRHDTHGDASKASTMILLKRSIIKRLPNRSTTDTHEIAEELLSQFNIIPKYNSLLADRQVSHPQLKFPQFNPDDTTRDMSLD
jgi:hypothetical protein